LTDFWVILLIALALAIDAFAVALTAGAYFKKTTFRQKFRLSFHFGLFQFLMPIIGWFAGSSIVVYISSFDHWIAMLILSVIGIKMIKDGLRNDGREKYRNDITRGLTLISLSVATSIDALAVGFSIGIVEQAIFYPSIIIGVVAALMTLIGIQLGEKLSLKFGNKVAIIGGIILILIGIKIVIEHIT
jgi:putative Mn2+ efflux pump MntP